MKTLILKDLPGCLIFNTARPTERPNHLISIRIRLTNYPKYLFFHTKLWLEGAAGPSLYLPMATTTARYPASPRNRYLIGFQWCKVTMKGVINFTLGMPRPNTAQRRVVVVAARFEAYQDWIDELIEIN